MKMLSVRVTDELDQALREAACQSHHRNLSAFITDVLAASVREKLPVLFASKKAPKLTRPSYRRTIIRSVPTTFAVAQKRASSLRPK